MLTRWWFEFQRSFGGGGVEVGKDCMSVSFVRSLVHSFSSRLLYPQPAVETPVLLFFTNRFKMPLKLFLIQFIEHLLQGRHNAYVTRSHQDKHHDSHCTGETVEALRGQLTHPKSWKRKSGFKPSRAWLQSLGCGWDFKIWIFES